MKTQTLLSICISSTILLSTACKTKENNSQNSQPQQTTQQDNKLVTSPANALKLNGRDVKGTIIIDTSEDKNGPVVTDGDTNAIEGKNIEKLRLQATKWNHEAIGIIPATDSYNDLEKAVEDMIKGSGDSFDVVEKGTNCLFYHCKIKVYDGKDLYGFIAYVKDKSKGYVLYCDGNYMSPSSGIAAGFIEEKDDAMKVYKIAQTFQPTE